ncbi:MAG TPA: SDR family oxidoreductase [Steroidobacteraceae bacterium]|nr:SDR family oxidoreductase [Steroidobacteraceae bacterium]
MSRLAGRVALVSGALRGIGLAITERFLAEGAAVVLTDLAAPHDPAVKQALARLGPGASYVRLDVAREADWLAALPEVRTRQGRLDILVNNAGVDCTGAVETLEFAAWRRIMSINVDGVFLGTKTFTPLLAETGRTTAFGSSIINISSIMGLVGYSDTSAYNAGKGAVRLFTKSVAIEFATKRTPIRVNSIHPGFVRTPLLEIGMRKWAEQGLAASAQDLIDSIAAATPNGRLAQPAEIAGAAFFLACDDSSYCTGSELVVDGGWTAR